MGFLDNHQSQACTLTAVCLQSNPMMEEIFLRSDNVVQIWLRHSCLAQYQVVGLKCLMSANIWGDCIESKDHRKSPFSVQDTNVCFEVCRRIASTQSLTVEKV